MVKRKKSIAAKRKKRQRVKDTDGHDVVHGCYGCPSYCCHDLAMIITRPADRDEKDELKWQLQYDTVNICIRNHRWYILIKGRCIYLDKNNRCKIYDKRPDRCRRHNFPNCERTGKWYDTLISTPEELEAYLMHKVKKKRK